MPDKDYLLGEMNGKLDALLRMMEEHVKLDSERFAGLDKKLDEHAAVLNQAKGAKTMLFVLAGVVSFFVSLLVKFVGR